MSLLDQDYDPETYDETMQEYLGENYDEQEETLAPEELLKGMEGDLWKGVGPSAELEIQCDPLKATEADDNLHIPDVVSTNEEVHIDTDFMGDRDNEAEGCGISDDHEWFLCDACENPILPGKKMFESQGKEDYIICLKCYKGHCYEGDMGFHKFRRGKVPDTAVVPESWSLRKGKSKEEGGEINAEKIQQDLEKRLEEYRELEDEQILFSTKNATSTNTDSALNMPFQYTETVCEDFGLTPEQILAMDDKELNSKASLKFITRPYRQVSTYQDSRTEKFEAMQKRVRKEKRKKQVKTGITRERLAAYKSHLGKVLKK